MQLPDQALVSRIEASAVEMARSAGAILSKHFGAPLKVEYKDDKQLDPVTVADKECQDFIADSVVRSYPDHGFVGEESEPEEVTAPEFVWVVDPLDGTKNFLSGLPVFACSIGVLFRGAPIAGAIFIPWPGEGNGAVMHARVGGGAFLENRPIKVSGGLQPEPGRLVSVPAMFGERFRLRRAMRGKTGEARVTGSIAYELAMTACGVLQYSIISGPRLWDVAGGVVIVTEAEGAVMAGSPEGGLTVGRRTRWEPLKSFAPNWAGGGTTLKDLGQWSAPLVLGSPGVVKYVTENLERRSRLRRRLATGVRRLTRGGERTG